MNNLVTMTLHGELGESIGKTWNFAVKSVSQAIHALNTITSNSFTNYFVNNNKLQAKYRILINGQDFTAPVNEINEGNAEMVRNSELIMGKENLKTIDIVPFIENSDSKTLGIFTTILAVVLIIIGIATFGEGGGFLIAVGVTLLAAGVAALLARPPDIGNFRQIDKAGKESYLFGGPTNIIGEGGVVPVGYGRIIAGSQVISSAYQIVNFAATI